MFGVIQKVHIGMYIDEILAIFDHLILQTPVNIFNNFCGRRHHRGRSLGGAAAFGMRFGGAPDAAVAIKIKNLRRAGL